MEKNNNHVFLLVSSILGYIYGILTLIALIGIPILIGAVKYSKWSKMSDQDLLKEKDSMLIWGVVFTVLMFPIGLVALFPAFNLEGELYTSGPKKDTYKPTEANSSSNSQSKSDKIIELEKLRETGVITEEDFEKMKEQIINE